MMNQPNPYESYPVSLSLSNVWADEDGVGHLTVAFGDNSQKTFEIGGIEQSLTTLLAAAIHSFNAFVPSVEFSMTSEDGDIEYEWSLITSGELQIRTAVHCTTDHATEEFRLRKKIDRLQFANELVRFAHQTIGEYGPEGSKAKLLKKPPATLLKALEEIIIEEKEREF